MESILVTAINIIPLIAVFIMSAVAHEIGHGYAALRLGDPTAQDLGRLTFNPIKHLDPIGSLVVPIALYMTSGFVFGWMRPVPVRQENLNNPKTDFGWVGIAGPAVNIAIAFIIGTLIKLSIIAGIITSSSYILDILVFAVIINILLAVINMIPIPPLDGSRVLFALLPSSFQGIREQLERYALLSLFIAMFVIINTFQYIWVVVGFIFTVFTGTSF